MGHFSIAILKLLEGKFQSLCLGDEAGICFAVDKI
jgi:hypothetical protein